MDERVPSHILVERVKKFSLIRSTRFSDFSFAYIVFYYTGGNSDFTINNLVHTPLISQ